MGKTKIVLLLIFVSLLILPIYLNPNVFASSLGIPNPLILNSNQLEISNPASNHAVTVKTGAFTINKTVTIPANIATSDTFVTEQRINSFYSTNAFVDGLNKLGCNTGIMGFVIQNNGVPSERICFNLSGMSSNTGLIISSNQTTSQQLYIPNIVSKDTLMTQVGQNQTSDADAISNIPISNHHCDWYFVTGNSTFRLICNLNNQVHVLSRG